MVKKMMKLLTSKSNKLGSVKRIDDKTFLVITQNVYHKVCAVDGILKKNNFTYVFDCDHSMFNRAVFVVEGTEDDSQTVHELLKNHSLS